MFRLLREATPAELATSHRHQWPVRMSAFNSSDDTPASIFVMQKAAPGEFDRDRFSCVASVQQMEDLPVGAPDSSGPFYRVDSVTVLARSAEAALEFELKVTEAVQDLANNIAASAVLSDSAETLITPQNA
jgi:hypothetical protein